MATKSETSGRISIEDSEAIASGRSAIEQSAQLVEDKITQTEGWCPGLWMRTNSTTNAQHTTLIDHSRTLNDMGILIEAIVANGPFDVSGVLSMSERTAANIVRHVRTVLPEDERANTVAVIQAIQTVQLDLQDRIIRNLDGED